IGLPPLSSFTKNTASSARSTSAGNATSNLRPKVITLLFSGQRNLARLLGRSRRRRVLHQRDLRGAPVKHGHNAAQHHERRAIPYPRHERLPVQAHLPAPLTVRLAKH